MIRRSNSSSSSGLEFDLHAETRRRLVNEINCLVREKPVGNITVRQSRGGNDGSIGDTNAMVQFVFFLEAA